MLTRRELLDLCLRAGTGFAVAVCTGLLGTLASRHSGSKRLGTLPFLGEEGRAVGHATGKGLGGRLALDLSRLDADSLVTPNGRFFVRTAYPDGLDPDATWTLRVTGRVKRPLELAVRDLEDDVEHCGVHLLECAGNSRNRHFGLISAADWSGIAIEKLLERAGSERRSDRVLVHGRDDHSKPVPGSVRGASWIFTKDELEDAFLATHMNGRSLPADHGQPLRLVVPGWYGCACIKWVDEIRLVADDAPATSQMKEFTGRTHQEGVPHLATDYQPALIDLAAMPVRVETWEVEGKIVHKVVGIAWGADRPTNALEIRFGSKESYAPVHRQIEKDHPAWSLWTHPWKPPEAGEYSIRLRVNDETVRTRRLDSGYYARTVRVSSK